MMNLDLFSGPVAPRLGRRCGENCILLIRLVANISTLKKIAANQ
jgi:hypothetical protein